MQAHNPSFHTPMAPGVGSKGQNIIFSERSMLHIYQIKGNGVLSTMQAHILSFHTSGVKRSKHFFF